MFAGAGEGVKCVITHFLVDLPGEKINISIINYIVHVYNKQ